MGAWCLEGWRRFVPGTDLKGCRKEVRGLEEGEREGHGPKTGRSAMEEEKKLSLRSWLGINVGNRG